MQVISLQQNFTQPVVLCLGFFDCMHAGHLKLLSRAKEIAQGKAQIALFTFENSHLEALKRPLKLIYTFPERLSIYESLGVQTVVTAKFDSAFMATTGREFLSEIAKLNLVGVVCGADYTCGSDLLSAQEVKNYLAGTVPVEIVDLVMHGSQKACSTFVRELLAAGHVEQANSWLSQPFFYTGIVTHGRNVGQQLGFPTVNLQIPDEKIVANGVFGGVCTVDGISHKTIVNVGAKPTFGQQVPSVEAHLLGFDGDLYGKNVKIALTKYLRPIQKFENAQKLREQLQKDTEAIDD